MMAVSNFRENLPPSFMVPDDPLWPQQMKTQAMADKLPSGHEACVNHVGDGALAIAVMLKDLDEKEEVFRP